MTDIGTEPALRAVVRRPEEAERIGQGAETLTYLLTGEDTGGAFAMIERTVAPNFVSPPQFHAHKADDWMLYVLEGKLCLAFEDRVAELSAGSVGYVPRGTYFRWWNPLPEPARGLFVYTPATFANFFREAIALTNRKAERIHDYDRTLPDILSVQDRYGMLRRPAR